MLSDNVLIDAGKGEKPRKLLAQGRRGLWGGGGENGEHLLTAPREKGGVQGRYKQPRAPRRGACGTRKEKPNWKKEPIAYFLLKKEWGGFSKKRMMGGRIAGDFSQQGKEETRGKCDQIIK